MKNNIKVISDYTIDPSDRILTENNLKEFSKIFSNFSKIKIDKSINNQNDIFRIIDEPYKLSNIQKKKILKSANNFIELLANNKNIKNKKLGKLSKTDKYKFNNIISTFVDNFFENPSINSSLILANNRNSGLTITQVGNNYYSVENSIPLLLASTVTGSGAKAAFSVDVIIEFISLLTSLAGLSIKMPKGARKAIARTIAKFARNPRNKKLLKELYFALYRQDWTKILHIIDKVEFSTFIGEIFHHTYAEMGIEDYIVTALKFAAFLALIVATGGWALGIRIAAVGLDVLGIGIKLKHGIDRGWM